MLVCCIYKNAKILCSSLQSYTYNKIVIRSSKSSCFIIRDVDRHASYRSSRYNKTTCVDLRHQNVIVNTNIC